MPTRPLCSIDHRFHIWPRRHKDTEKKTRSARRGAAQRRARRSLCLSVSVACPNQYVSIITKCCTWESSTEALEAICVGFRSTFIDQLCLVVRCDSNSKNAKGPVGLVDLLDSSIQHDDARACFAWNLKLHGSEALL